MPTRLIFVRHGQLPDEKPKGLALAKMIDETPGFRAFFAEAVQSTDALSEHIFANLERCDGFLAVMHRRGGVTFPDRPPFIRSSVWIQQELAIVSFINYQRHLARRIKIRVFAQRGIKREGLADTLILNPVEFDSDEELRPLVREWLAGPDFSEDRVTTTREALFQRLTSDFTEEHWRFLEVMMVLSRGTSEDVTDVHVRRMLEQMDHIQAWRGRISLIKRGFLRQEKETSALMPAFLDLVAEELRRRGPTWPARE